MIQFYFDVWDADSLNGTALGELTIRWTGSAEGEIAIEDEFDDFDEPDRGDDNEPGGTE